jgi:hypothetical protein
VSTNLQALSGFFNLSNLTRDVTADSYLTILSDKNGISRDAVSNVMGNGFTVYYNKEANKELGGKTYNLAKGGKLTPQK